MIRYAHIGEPGNFCTIFSFSIGASSDPRTFAFLAIMYTCSYAGSLMVKVLIARNFIQLLIMMPPCRTVGSLASATVCNANIV